MDILCIGFPAWEGDYLKSTVQLVGELARQHRVLYVEYPFTWKDVAMGILGKSRAPWRRILGRENRLRTLPLPNGASVDVLTLPPMLPVNFLRGEQAYDLWMGQNAKRAFASIRRAMDVLGMSRPLVLNAFNPFLGVFLARQFDERALVYYCYDEIGGARWANRHGARLERQFLRQVDAVVASSKPLFEKKKTTAARAFLVKNGVDFDLFNRPNLSPQPSTRAPQPSPTIGYLGSVDERLDYDLLETLAQARPDWHFRFVGRANCPAGVERLQRFANVELAGSRPPETLPDEVRGFDACIIPFLKNKLTAGIYPLKINEYLACGKPVVSTGFGDMEDFRQVVQVADSPPDFLKKLEQSLAAKSPGDRENRIAFAQENAWPQRAAQLSSVLSEVEESVAIERRALVAVGLPAWMPDNFNRWGPVSAGFFRKPARERSDLDYSPTPSVIPAELAAAC